MPPEVTKLFDPTAPHAAIAIAVGALLVIGIIVIAALTTSTLAQALRKLGYLTANALVVDLGWREVVYWSTLALFGAVATALAKGWGNPGEPFHWETFVTVLIVIAGTQALGALFHLLTKSGTVLRPVHGTFWRTERKSATAAIIQRVNDQLGKGADTEAVRATLSDLLRVIVLHVRDHRGDHRKVRVFANLLLADGDDMVVVARDPHLMGPQFKRPVPVRYKKATLAAGRAFDAGTVVSVGDIRLEYPEGPKNKPYVSMLAIPLFGSTDNRAIAVLSIDSSRPYFFETFVLNAAENALENSLAPYARMLVLVLETLLSRDPSAMLRALAPTA